MSSGGCRRCSYLILVLGFRKEGEVREILLVFCFNFKKIFWKFFIKKFDLYFISYKNLVTWLYGVLKKVGIGRGVVGYIFNLIIKDFC